MTIHNGQGTYRQDRSQASAATWSDSLLSPTERELLEAKEAAERHVQEIIKHVNQVVHEIRNPLNGIIPLIELLRSGEYEEDRAKFLEYMDISARMIQTLVNNMLDMAQIDAGKLSLKPCAFSPSRILEEAVQSHTGAFLSKGLPVAMSIMPDVPQWVEGDAFRIRQILMNLLGNAVKFTEKGGITATIAVHNEHNGYVMLRFSINDTGIGMPTETVQRLFVPFSQGDASVAGKFGGTGLGLAICRKLAELMGGHIWVESVPNEGSTFHLLLPFQALASAEYSI